MRIILAFRLCGVFYFSAPIPMYRAEGVGSETVEKSPLRSLRRLYAKAKRPIAPLPRGRRALHPLKFASERSRLLITTPFQRKA